MSNLRGCAKTNQSPGTNDASGGWLQLTDASGDSTGTAVYDQAIPARYGLIAEFDQAQYSTAGVNNAADGISFFLT